MCREADGARVGARHLLDDDGGMSEVAASAAVSLWNETTKQSGASCFPPDVPWNDSLRFPPRMMGSDLALDEAPDLIPKHPVILSAGFWHAGSHLRADDPHRSSTMEAGQTLSTQHSE